MKEKNGLSLLLARPLAYMLDFLFLALSLLLPQWAAYQIFDGFPFDLFSKPWQVYCWNLVTVSLPVWLYFILLEKSARQATWGKRIMGLSVVSNREERIGSAQSFTRTLLRLLPWEITHIALTDFYFNPEPVINTGLYTANIIIIFYVIVFIASKGTLSFHDMLSKTTVVRKMKEEFPTPPL